MPLYTFSCTCGWSGDQRTTFEANNVRCPSCEATAHKESVYRISFGGFARTPSEERDWSRDYKAFREASEDISYHESVVSRVEGTTVQGPNLYAAAKAKADTLIAKGATVDDL